MATNTIARGDVASPLAEPLDDYFGIKTSCDVEGTMSWFSHDLTTYTDATLGWDCDSYEAVKTVFERYMPTWGAAARSYSTRTLSNDHSALIHMVDTPELFGGELRILAAVDFADGKIIRWVDYWDGTPFDADLYARLRAPADVFPGDLKYDAVPEQASEPMTTTAGHLHSALTTGDAGSVSAMLHTDVVVEDMSLRARILGGIEAAAYLSRVIDAAPYGRGSVLRHVVGGDAGGGFEWTAADGLVGITAIELADDGLITRITSVYDGRRLAAERRTALLDATFA